MHKLWPRNVVCYNRSIGIKSMQCMWPWYLVNIERLVLIWELHAM